MESFITKKILNLSLKYLHFNLSYLKYLFTHYFDQFPIKVF
jgi:hypothetical protein